MSSLSLFGAPAAPAVRRPAFELSFGSATAAEWARAVVSVELETGLAPAVDALVVVLGTGAPAVGVGDEGRVSLGYEGALESVFAGAVESVRRSLRQGTRLVAGNAGSALARTRVNQSFENQGAGDVVRELASRAGVDATVSAGIDLPFLVVDDRRSAWGHVAALAERSGYVAAVAPDGGVVFGPARQGPPVQTFTVGVDVLALAAAERTPLAGEVTVVGEGAAGSKGAAAWSRLVKDSRSVTATAGSGEPARLREDPALRSADAARTAATSLAAAAAAATAAGRVVVPGAPVVRPGDPIELAGAADPALNGVWRVRALRHRFAKREGFTTTIDFGRP